MQLKSILSKQGAAFLLISLAASCSSSNDPTPPVGVPTAPTVLTNSPVAQATNVPINTGIAASFSEAMNSSTLNNITFTVTSAPAATPVAGTVIYANSRVVFRPAAQLAGNGTFTATITTGAQDLSGVGLAGNYVWRFTTGTTLAPRDPVDLGTAGGFAILAKAGISTVPTSIITGNLGISPAAASFITGFALTLDASNGFSTSSQVTGRVYAADYASPTPANLTTSVLDMETAFTDAAARAPDVTELGAGNIGGLTLVPGVYKWGTGLLIPTNVTLTGSATDVWIFQIAQDLVVSSATSVVLAGGALPENIFWQVSGLVNLGSTASFNGIILTATAITMQTGSSVNGRLLAQTAVSIDGSTIIAP